MAIKDSFNWSIITSKTTIIVKKTINTKIKIKVIEVELNENQRVKEVD